MLGVFASLAMKISVRFKSEYLHQFHKQFHQFWGTSANGNTLRLHRRVWGSIPQSSTKIHQGECHKGGNSVWSREERVGSNPTALTKF